MGLHLIALAKIRFLSSSHGFTTPLLAGLICPFVLKLSFSSRIVRRVYIDAIDATRLFLFQLSQIVFDSNQPAVAAAEAAAPPNIGHRWQRALRLLCQRVAHVRRTPAGQSDEDSFHTLTMLSL